MFLKVMVLKVLILMVCFCVNCDEDSGWSFVGNPLLAAYPCNDSTDMSISYEPGRPPEEENQYYLFIRKDFPVSTKIHLTFDSDAIVSLADKTYARLTVTDNTFTVHYFVAHSGLSLEVKGTTQGVIPYITGVIINNKKYCKEPNVGNLDVYVSGYQYQATNIKKKSDKLCGKPKVTHTELIVNGLTTKPGDWPWHVALYRQDGTSIKYICGGTLISNNFVLTAAHCTIIRGVPVIPEILFVVLAKFNLIGGDVASQEKQVHQIIVHKQFQYRTLNNDIALLKLKTEVVFDDYIQPACLWHVNLLNQLPTNEVHGTVVGWGFDQTDSLSAQLRKANLPILAESTCLKRNPLFYSKILNENKFCAGLENGTSPCNGDSGGGFLVFVPDTAKDTSPKADGSWYVRGIVSVSVSRNDAPLCDPEQYVVFTDISKYNVWIDGHVNKK